MTQHGFSAGRCSGLLQHYAVPVFYPQSHPHLMLSCATSVCLGSPPGTRVCNALKSLKVVPVTADVNNHMGE
jgi:hypothetical protein